MNRFTQWRRVVAFTAVLLLALGGTAFAQLQSGNVYGIVSDNAGAALPGVNVSLTGGGAPQLQGTDLQGQFRFLGLPPGTYRIEAALDGFSTVVYESVSVAVGKNTTLELVMSAAIEDVITVTSESPLLDSRKIVTGATVSATELEKIPTSRDPWAIMQSVPGVKTDRINVGGNESGQQSNFTGPGSTGDDGVFALDGVVITDMAAIGSSPTYYNFDAFQEMQVSTGGNDASMASGGVNMNMVTKRGTNEWRVGGRYITGDGDWQSDIEFSQGDLGEGQADFGGSGNRIVDVEDWGADVGGPIVQDKLWIWANYGEQNIELLTLDDVSDKTNLETYGAKMNAQLGSSNSATLFYNYGDKVKIGRNAGPTRPQPTTWNQTGPTDIQKIEDTQIFSSSFFLTGMWSHVGGGFQLTPQAGLDGPAITFDEDFVWQNNYFHHDTDRPQDQFKIDGNYFFSTGDLSHELKFGAGYRTAELISQSLFPGDGLRLDFYTSFGYDYNIFQVSRSYQNDSDAQYTSAYLQDTLTVGNLTANIGVRYDLQEGSINATDIPGVAGFESYDDGTPWLPAASTNSKDQGFDWDDISPRLGLTYALGEEKKTLLRFSYAQFAEQFRNGYALQEATGFAAYSYFYYEDRNNDGFVTKDELIDLDGDGLITPDDELFNNEYDPFAQTQVNLTDRGFSAPITQEMILAVEHSILPELVIGATVTLRNKDNIAEFERLVEENGVIRPHQRSDYVLDRTITGTLPDGRGGGQSYSIPFYQFRDGLRDVGGSYMTNGNREQDYTGFSLTFNKRLSNRWMLRGNYTWQDWEWDVPDSENEDPNLYLGGARDDGGPVLEGSGTGSGSKGGIYINSSWQYSITGMYQIAPDQAWGFNVSAGINGREGYPIPFYVGRVTGFEAGSVNLQATNDSDDYRQDDIHMIDLRVEKEVNISDFGLTFGVEVFNLFNDSTVLQSEHRLARSNTDFVREIVSPRMFRATFRFSFN